MFEWPLVTVSLLVLCVIYFICMAAYEILRHLARFGLGLDAENAPDMLGDNWFLRVALNILLSKSKRWEVKKLSDTKWGVQDIKTREYWDASDSTVSKEIYCGCKFKTEERATAVADALNSRFSNIIAANLKLIFGTIGICILIDLLWLWGLHHLTSLIYIGVPVSMLLLLRQLSLKVWNHRGRIIKLEEVPVEE